MASKMDNLLAAFEVVIQEPWTGTLSTSERIMFLVYDPAEQRKLGLKIDEFERATRKAGKKWAVISVKLFFPEWMSGHDYRDDYFKDPEALIDQLEGDFKKYAVNQLNQRIADANPDAETLVALTDVSSLFGFIRLSDLLNSIDSQFKGRLLVFFPGEFDKNHFRLMDARDGWSYLARPITA